MTLVAEVDLIGLGDGLGVLRQPTPGDRIKQLPGRSPFLVTFFAACKSFAAAGALSYW